MRFRTNIPALIIGVALTLMSSTARGQCTADFEFTVNGLTVEFTNTSSGSNLNHSWDFGDATLISTLIDPVHEYINEGEYEVCLTVSNSNNCTDTKCDTISICPNCVWPGDADANTIVDNKDVLAVGLAFGKVGPVRTDQNINFEGKDAVVWLDNGGGFANVGNTNTNVKHADCDGNGVVNQFDIRAIDQNYSRRYNKDFAQQCLNSSDPPLYFEILEDSVPVGASVSIAIKLGTQFVPANQAYGIAYKVHFDTELVDTLNLSYAASDLRHQDTLVFLNKYFTPEGRLETAVSRTDQMGVQVAGPIGTLNFVMEDNLAAKDQVISKYLHLFFSDIKLIQNDGSVIDVCPITDSLKVYQLVSSDDDDVKTGLGDGDTPQFKVYPNPARDQLIIETGKTIVERMYLTNMLGQVMLEENQHQQGNIQLQVEGLPGGLYFLTLVTDNHPFTIRLKIDQ